MSLQQLKRELAELKRSLQARSGPMCKVFISGMWDSHSEAEIQAYKAANPHTHILKLTRKSCRRVE